MQRSRELWGGEGLLGTDLDLSGGFTLVGTVALTSAGDQTLEISVGSAVINEPPNCSNAKPSVTQLWPPNHKFWSVKVLGVTDPDGDPITITITSILQDEPVNGRGDGDSSPDGKGVGIDTAQVRAERQGVQWSDVSHWVLGR